MPDWCYNRVEIEGPIDKVKSLISTMDTSEGKTCTEPEAALEKRTEVSAVFDFDALIPVPKELFDTQPSFSGTGSQCEPSRRWVKDENGKEVPEPLSRAEEERLVEEYGATNWYHWRCDHWGTKWNACGVTIKVESSSKVEGQMRVRYFLETAWCPPVPIFGALREKFPDVRITWFYWCQYGDFEGYLTDEETKLPKRRSIPFAYSDAGREAEDKIAVHLAGEAD